MLFIKARLIDIHLIIQNELLYRTGENDLSFFLFSNKQFSGRQKCKRSQTL